MLSFCFASADSTEKKPKTIVPATASPQRNFIVGAQQNNAYVKAISERMKYRNMILQEADTIQSIIDTIR